MVESDAQHVDRRRRKDVRISEGRLTGFRSLETLLESATIRDAAEDAGDKLGIVYIAEAEEDLVLLGRIDVDAGINRVLMLEKIGA